MTKRFDVWVNTGRKVLTNLSAEVAGEAVGIDPTEIEWAVEEYGRCDTTDWTVVEHGSLRPSPREWQNTGDA